VILTVSCPCEHPPKSLSVVTNAVPGDITIKIGTSPRLLAVETDFTVTPDTSSGTATPSQGARRRRAFEADYIKRHGVPAPPQAAGQALARAEQQHQESFLCAKGASYCWTGKGLGFECIDTSTDVLCTLLEIKSIRMT
jgi:hypothetical protein